MSQPKLTIPMEIIDDPEVNEKLFFLWSRLELLRMRQKSDVINLGAKWVRLTKETGATRARHEREVNKLSQLGYLQVEDDGRLSLKCGARFGESTQEEPTPIPTPKEPSPVPNPNSVSTDTPQEVEGSKPTTPAKTRKKAKRSRRKKPDPWNEDEEFIRRGQDFMRVWRAFSLERPCVKVPDDTSGLRKALWLARKEIREKHKYDPLDRLDDFQAGFLRWLDNLSPENAENPRYPIWICQKDKSTGVIWLAKMIDKAPPKEDTSPKNYAKEYGIPERYWVTQHHYAKLNGDPSELLVVEDGEERGRDTDELEAIGWKQTVCIPELDQYL